MQFERYSTRYRNGLSLVLKDISVDIPGRTKVSEYLIELCTVGQTHVDIAVAVCNVRMKQAKVMDPHPEQSLDVVVIYFPQGGSVYTCT